VRAARLVLLPCLILAVALGITWLVWDHERQATRKELRSQFDFSLREAVSRVEQRTSTYEQILRGVQGLFTTTMLTDHDVFREYVGSLQLDANFAGIQAIGVAEYVLPARKEAHVALIRKLGLRDYAIQPEGLRESYAPVTQREPSVGRNRVGLGFDAWADPVRRLAMESARDTGMAAISGKVRLEADTDAETTPGFVMYLPIYARGQAHDSVARRRDSLVGWVFASVHVHDLMASLYGEAPPGLAFAVYDGVVPSDASLLYRSANTGDRRQSTALVADEYLVVAGHTWTLSMIALDEFDARFGRDAAPLIAVAGTGLGLLLAMLAWLLATGRARALRLAVDMTRELSKSEEKYRALVETTGTGYLILDMKGKVVDANPEYVRLTGHGELRDILGRHVTEWTASSDNEKNSTAVAECAGVGSIRDLVIDYVDSNGRITPVEINATVVGAGDSQRIISLCRDFTNRKQAEVRHAQLEAQLRESQKMEALGTLAGGVAHDFNNALAMIVGNLELARQDVGAGHAALVSLEEIGKASRRAKDLVQQILAFSRRQTIERKPTTLSLVVLESARLLRASLPAKVRLNVDCKADAPAVLADAAQVKQILLNLCSNAAHAVEAEERPGVLEVRLEACTLGEARGDLRPGRYACLTVRDNGPGMDETMRSRIFEPFFTTKPVGQGTGLGLSVVHGIAQAHEASIEVDSTLGEGTTFRVYFPAVDAPVLDVLVPPPSATPVQGKGGHILFVDDEQGLVLLMKRLLTRQGFRFSGYDDPREALEAVRANPDQFDLVVTDYNMPHISGLELAQAVKEIRADLPVILASGYITEELRAKAPAAGIRELIYKPNTVDDLCEAIVRYANAQTAGERGGNVGT